MMKDIVFERNNNHKRMEILGKTTNLTRANTNSECTASL